MKFIKQVAHVNVHTLSAFKPHSSITLICLEHALISLILAMQAGVRPSFNYTCTALVMYTGPLWSPL